MKTFSRLFTPIRIGNLEVKNRIVFPPMVSGHAAGDGKVTEGHIAWYGARAKGGVGLLIVEFTAVAQLGTAGPVLLGIWDDEHIPGLQKLTKAIHSYDAKVFLQLAHAGRQTSKEAIGGKSPVAPSAISCPLREPLLKEIPEELSIEQIEEIIRHFGTAARRAKEAGFDGLEIHGAHGYLISEFMSAYTNKRHDSYGGNLLGRMRFPLEIIKSVRREVGGNFPVCFRYSGNEYVPDGRTIEESRRVARILQDAGVDCLHVAAGVYESFWSQIPPHGIREAVNAEDAAAIKKDVKIPLITVGRIKSPEIAEEVLEQGKADMVALGRQLICDPEWPMKVAAGSLDDIRPCIGCTEGCINRAIVEQKQTACIYNTSAGYENEVIIRRSSSAKKVLVIGGGPGGLEAARVAALRGHHVILLEKTKKLGGRFNLACIAPFKQEFALPIQWLSNQVKKLGVQVEMGKEATSEIVEKIGPDAVIIATGAVPKLPGISGIERKEVVIAEDILAGKTSMGTRVVILGGGAIGAEVADFMGQRGKKVTIVEMLPEIGVPTGIPLLVAQLLLPRLARYGVTIMTRALAKKITKEGVAVNVEGRDEVITGIDQVIVATGTKPVNELAGKLEGKVPAIYVIGDAKAPRRAFEATQEGCEAARLI